MSFIPLLSFLILGQFYAEHSFAGLHARQLGLMFGSYPSGKRNSISDVAGVSVGHVSLIEGEGKRITGKGPIRTGVTVVLPAADDIWAKPLIGGSFVFNGVGEALGLAGLQEMGLIEAPIGLTNTLSVVDVQKGLVKHVLKKHPEVESLMPIVLECDDSSLNDIHGLYVKPEHVTQAIARATADFEEGSVGAGVGMISFDFKSGIGSASRIIIINKTKYTVGILANANIGTGTRQVFRILGVQMAPIFRDLMPTEHPWQNKGDGSVVMVLATDTPLDFRQLNRLARRAMSGVLRLGTPGYNGSGDFIVAFSTANRAPRNQDLRLTKTLSDRNLNDVFEAVADAAEESVVNSMLASKTMSGRDNNKVFGLPHDRIKNIFPPK